jgi:hypothetical protein
MYWYRAMWRAFQTAAACNVDEEPSEPRPMLARCWLTSDTTWLA